jgi:hypothetical protein
MDIAHARYLEARRTKTIVEGLAFAAKLKDTSVETGCVENWIQELDYLSLEKWVATKILGELGITELRKLGKKHKIPYYSRVSKVELIQAIEECGKHK